MIALLLWVSWGPILAAGAGLCGDGETFGKFENERYKKGAEYR